jgi:hypothetical protein
MTSPVVPVNLGVVAPTRRKAGLLRQLLSRPDGLAGLVILAFFTVLAMFPTLLVGPLETAITAATRWERTSWDARCSTWSSTPPGCRW